MLSLVKKGCHYEIFFMDFFYDFSKKKHKQNKVDIHLTENLCHKKWKNQLKIV